MYILYNIAITIYGFIVSIVSLFNPKAKLWIEGRKNIFVSLKKDINKSDKPIWFHAASLGEFEQGRPIIEELKKRFPEKKILLTFYSPSGYEVRKDYNVVDWVYYLPLDTKYNTNKFIEIVNPSMAIFIKYEFWPNIIKALYLSKINTIVISAIFKNDQVFFKNYGGWMRKSLYKFTNFFVQDENSVELLNSIGINTVIKSGDTRFDRVMDILQNDNTLNFVENFKGDNKLFIAGSTWPDDDKILIEYINRSKSSTKTIIAPHNISSAYNNKLSSKITKRCILYSEMKNVDLKEYDVLILDTIGILTKVYSYADIAYVGGGFGKEGIHNILEPAVFSIPVIVGPIFHQFKEAVELNGINGIVVANSSDEFISNMCDFEKNKLNTYGSVAFEYIKNSSGAQQIVIDYISKYIDK